MLGYEPWALEGEAMVYILCVCLAAVSAEPLTDAQIAQAIAVAAEIECEQIAEQSAALQKQLKRPDRSKNARRNKIALKKQMRVLKKRAVDLKQGKVMPYPSLKAGMLRTGQVGVFRGVYSRARIIGLSSHGAEVSVSLTTLYPKRGGYGFHRKISWSTPFVLAGVEGIIGDNIDIPTSIWYVQAPKNGVRVLLPVTEPLKPRVKKK